MNIKTNILKIEVKYVVIHFCIKTKNIIALLITGSIFHVLHDNYSK